MTKTHFVILIFAFTLIQAGTTWVMRNVAPQKWEYRTQYISRGKEDLYYGADLKDLGYEKWELVSVVPDGKGRQVCFLKRPKPTVIELR